MLEMQKAGKRFGSTHALREIDLEVRDGESLLLSGPNGSGKSTLLRLVCGVLRPTSGEVRLWGKPPIEMRSRVGYIGHDPRLYPYLTLEENLVFFARLYVAPEDRARGLIETIGLQRKRTALAHTMSRGELQRASIARAVLHDPDLLLADEPFTGLDEEAAAIVPTILSRPGRSVIVASHDAERARAMVSRTVRLEGGRLISRAVR